MASCSPITTSWAISKRIKTSLCDSRPSRSAQHSMRLGDVDQRAVGIGELKAAVRAFAQQCQSRRALGIEVDRLRRQMDVGLGDLVDVGLESGKRRHAEADVI